MRNVFACKNYHTIVSEHAQYRIRPVWDFITAYLDAIDKVPARRLTSEYGRNDRHRIYLGAGGDDDDNCGANSDDNDGTQLAERIDGVRALCR